MFKTHWINCIVNSSIDELQLTDWITNPFGHQGYGILCIYACHIIWFARFLPTDFVSGVTNHSLRLNSYGVTTHRLCWEEHLHLWFDDLQNSESIHGWNNTRYKETQHQTLHFSSISILQTLLSSIETSMDLNSFPKWRNTIKFSASHHKPRTSCQGLPTQWQWCHCAPRLISILIIWHLRVPPRRMGTVTLMVQDFFGRLRIFGYFWRDFPRIWVWGLDLANISEILTKNGWIGAKCEAYWTSVFPTFAAVVSLRTTMIDLQVSPTSTLEQCLKFKMNLHHVPHTQTGNFSSIHFHDA